jgi:hypothetical protein
MQRVYDMCNSFDSDYLEPFERCKSYYTQFKHKNFKTTDDLKKRDNLAERKQFNDMRFRSAKDYSFGVQGWVKEFKNHMPYKKPFVVNGFEINDLFKAHMERGYEPQGFDGGDLDKADLSDQSLSSDEEEKK